MNKDLLLDGYDIVNQTILNFETRTVDHMDLSYNIRKEKVFLIEDQLTESEKLEIVDYHTNGLCSYLLDLMDKYWKDKDAEIIKKASWGSLNMNSLRKWVRANDPRRAFQNVLADYNTKHYPEYHLFGERYKLNRDSKTPTTDYSYKRLYDGESVVHQWFHDMLNEFVKKEKEYFVEHDPKHIVCKEINELHSHLTDSLWEVQDNLDIFNYRYDNISLERANEIKEVLQNIQTYIKDATYDLKNGGK